MTRFREIPSIEQLRQRPAMQALEREFGREAVVDALRKEADALREQLTAGAAEEDTAAALERAAGARVRAEHRASLRTVINATGVILHTNLGRAPLSEAAIDAVSRIARGYSNLEYDLESGSRGRRDVHAESLICRLSGADAACVVNNNAAATLLTLSALAAGREVIVSRGELVEIGGGFRVPDVMRQSGAILREVGTTNRTRIADYAAAIGDNTALLLRVHPSNFRIEGFTERPQLGELVALGRQFEIPVVEDLGSGWLGGSDIQVLRDEPAVAAGIDDGADVVLFSGDKLLGGPQAGIIAGKRPLLERVRRHPLMRALRADKMTYAALEATLQSHAAGRRHEVPTLGMLTMSREAIGARADALVKALASTALRARVIDGASTPGGGSAPEETLTTRLIELRGPETGADELASQLRRANPPIVARVQNDRVLLDLRTVLPDQDELLLAVLRQLTTTNSQFPTRPEP